MNRTKLLILLWILYPERDSAWYKNGLGSLWNKINWINPLTYLYLIGCIIYFGYLKLKYGKNWIEKLEEQSL